MNLNESIGLVANLCTIAAFVLPFWLSASQSVSITVFVWVSIIRNNKKHDQCDRTDRASDDH
ncbi:hypothetical protein [uncultured Faecalibaculum sp.]|uniref:hypothetical protein n=1 Tax=uncultured Faecalibaculum sp. TaxID=1729681 RepID=UPI00272E410E|nr:hypothetical protein [uncultured Faecalibaculum sp.]